MFRDVTGTLRITVPFRQIRENEVSKWQRVRQSGVYRTQHPKRWNIVCEDKVAKKLYYADDGGGGGTLDQLNF